MGMSGEWTRVDGGWIEHRYSMDREWDGEWARVDEGGRGMDEG